MMIVLMTFICHLHWNIIKPCEGKHCDLHYLSGMGGNFQIIRKNIIIGFKTKTVCELIQLPRYARVPLVMIRIMTSVKLSFKF